MNNATETIVCYLLDNLLALITLFCLHNYLLQALSHYESHTVESKIIRALEIIRVKK